MSFGNLDVYILREIFDLLPGHHLMLRLVCRHWAAVPFANKVTHYANVLGDVETFKFVATAMMSRPKIIYKYASFDVIMYLKSQDVDMAFLAAPAPMEKENASVRRYAEYRLYLILMDLVKYKLYQRGRLMPDFAATPRRDHVALLKLAKKHNYNFSTLQCVLEDRFRTKFDLNLDLIKEVYRDAWEQYPGLLYLFGWSDIRPSLMESPLREVWTYQPGMRAAGPWLLFGYESLDVCRRYLEMVGRAELHADVRWSVIDRGTDILSFLRAVYDKVDRLTAIGYIVEIHHLDFRVIPSQFSPGAISSREAFFLAASVADHRRCEHHIGCELGAVFFDNYDVLSNGRPGRTILMRLAVGMGRMRMAKALHKAGVPICGQPVDDQMFEWMVTRGWDAWDAWDAWDELTPNQALFLVKTGAIQIRNTGAQLKALKLLRVDHDPTGDLWRLYDYLVRNNYIYPSVLFSVIKPAHSLIVHRWARDGYLDKADKCPIPVVNTSESPFTPMLIASGISSSPLPERTQPKIKKNTRAEPTRRERMTITDEERAYLAAAKAYADRELKHIEPVSPTIEQQILHHVKDVRSMLWTLTTLIDRLATW